ncbi:MAG: hypothetical protein HFI17_18790 [Lachnospiraceae bacterium]|nr:hypothetical protein [Lachnospiraceae bacterium]
MQQLIDSGSWVDFTQGVDIRLMTEVRTVGQLFRRLLWMFKVKDVQFEQL